ncbi:Gfo/Idh/MocA family oxidoreductase [bacterium]|nr:Gfo/Idh/MocA family oxidoreductase [bacterium]
MAKYRSCLLGCGPRAKEHMAAYAGIEEMAMVAVCDRIAERRDEFQQLYGVAKVYDDYEAMLAAEQPDVVHVVTPPGHRLWECETAVKAGAKAIIVEKPMAVLPSTLDGLAKLRASTDCEIIVNCQRRYFPQFRDGTIARIVRNELGRVYCVRASTKGNIMGMGPHLMDLLMLFLGEAQPEAVWAMASDYHEESYFASHRAPEHVLAEYWFPDGLRAFLDCDTDALGTPGEESFWMHLHFDFLGTEGWLHLTQNGGYWYQRHGMAEPVRGESSWDHQQLGGQRDFTRAVAEWLDGGPEHLNRFAVSAAVVRALFGAYKSALVGRRVELPATLTDAEWHELMERVRKPQ